MIAPSDYSIENIDELYKFYVQEMGKSRRGTLELLDDEEAEFYKKIKLVVSLDKFESNYKAMSLEKRSRYIERLDYEKAIKGWARDFAQELLSILPGF